MKQFHVKASNLHATYDAGTFVAETREQAIEAARESYRNSAAGRELKDVGSFRFYTVTE